MADSKPRLMSFVTQEQADEIKKKRQEEWDRVRNSDDPIEAPPEVYDPRPLYERLKEQKDRAQEEYEEKFKFKNMIYKGLDDEEASFLNVIVDQHGMQMRNLINREKEELTAYREEVSRLVDEYEHNRPSDPLDSSLIAPPRKPTHSKSQTKALAGVIVTKRKRSSSSTSVQSTSEDAEEKKRKVDDKEVALKTNKIASLAAYSSSSSDEENND